MTSHGDRIRHFCSTHGIKLNTDLGQHFLIDEEVLRSIVEAGNIHTEDHIVEIGPGIGVLTAELVQRAAHVTAIEIDEHLIPLLKEYVLKEERRAASRLSIVNQNALEAPFPITPYKIIANIPYHITSPLLRHAFLESEVYPTSMTLLIQREVAEKICDTEDHGLLTILVGLFGKPKLIRIVPPEAFLPPPKVDSAVLHIDCFPKPLADAETIEEVFKLTKMGFSQKRKMLRNTLGNTPEGMTRLEKAGIEATRRPQTLTIEEWIRLAKESA